MPSFLINFVYFSELLTCTKFKCIKKNASPWKPQTKTERKKTKRSFKMSKTLLFSCSLTTKAKNSDGHKQKVKENNHD